MAIAKKPTKPEVQPEAVPQTAPVVDPAPAAAPVAAQMEEVDASVAFSPVEILDAAQAQVAEIRELGRTFAQQGADSLRAAYDRTRVAAEEAAASVEGIYGKVTDGARQLNIKAIDAAQTNTLAIFEMARAIIAAPSPAEAISLAGEHTSKQADLLARQVKEYADLTRSVSEATFKPVVETFEKSFGLKAA